MNNPKLMNILDATDYLFENFTGFVFIHPFLLHNIIEQFSLLHVLHH